MMGGDILKRLDNEDCIGAEVRLDEGNILFGMISFI